MKSLNTIRAWFSQNQQHYPLVSQYPQALGNIDPSLAATMKAILVWAWFQLERATGYKWKCTSYLRDSPSHSKGYAIDLAPDFEPAAGMDYAYAKGSDPVLYKRARLIRKLQRLVKLLEREYPTLPFVISYALEPDHIHVSLFQPLNNGREDKFIVVKWGGPKHVYSDTLSRSQLPLIK